MSLPPPRLSGTRCVERRRVDARDLARPRQQVAEERACRAPRRSRPAADRSTANSPLRVEKPGSIVCALYSVRTKRPADTSSTSDSATCATTSALPQARAPRRRDDSGPDDSFSAAHQIRRRALPAPGTSPNSERAAERQRRREQHHRQAQRRVERDRQPRRRDEQPQRDPRSSTRTIAPATPPPAASSVLSVSICRTRRPRLAPSARRTAVSRCRAGGARQQQAGDVRARDQQHDADDAESARSAPGSSSWLARRARATAG